ncbi:MAG: hypothetical protein NTU48_04910 [Legionellales bacterium]|nr:hypothetical protein [Legionellales bacterium]
MMRKTILTISGLLLTHIGFATSYPGTNAPPYPNEAITPFYYPQTQIVIDPRDDANRILSSPGPTNSQIQQQSDPPSTATGP